MTTGRINQVAFLRDVGTAWTSTHRRIGGEWPGRGSSIVRVEGQDAYEGRTDRRPPAHETFRIREHGRSTRAPTRPHHTGGKLGARGTIDVRPAAPKGHRTEEGLRDIPFPSREVRGTGSRLPPERRAHGEIMKRCAGRQFDAKSTEPANTHNHFTTHMPVAYAWQHPSTPSNDPPGRLLDR